MKDREFRTCFYADGNEHTKNIVQVSSQTLLFIFISFSFLFDLFLTKIPIAKKKITAYIL